MADLLPHGDATVEQGHLKSGAHLFAAGAATAKFNSEEWKQLVRNSKGSRFLASNKDAATLLGTG